MEYLFNSSFPVSTDKMLAKMKMLLKDMKYEELMWIAQNREFGEKERYRVKAEVDTSLKNTNIISAERNLIEEKFQRGSIIENTGMYLELYHKRMKQLNAAYEEIFGLKNSLKDLVFFWKQVVDISNLDNAHAMYLSSNNWEFSVFNEVLEELSEILEGDFGKLNPLLTAGVEDVRSAIFSQDDRYIGLSEKSFYNKILMTEDYIRQNGICPCFTYIAIKNPRLQEKMSREAYNLALEDVMESLDKPEQKRFIQVYDSYCKLYFTRLAYDTYEYFGYYAFLRHYAIFVTYKMLMNSNEEKANKFRHYASTYQFEQAINVLEGG